MKIRRAKKVEAQTELNLPEWEMGANAEQLEMIRHENGPLRGLASAGSGKTFAVTRRMVRLVKHCNVDGARIIAMTFSKKAGDEMNNRVRSLGVDDARVGTWHSFCLEVLKKSHLRSANDELYSTWEIDDKNRAKMFLKEILGWKNMNWLQADLNKVNSFITKCKSNLLDPSDPETKKFAEKTFTFNASKVLEAYSRYNEELANKALLTFDDMMIFVVRAFEKDEQLRQEWAGKYDYVICDEVQDNNRVQSRLAWLLAKDHRNYMVVGDCFQAIYSFRGSSPDYLATFEQEWPDAKTIVLPSNYRSGKSIINAANGIVKNAVIEGLPSVAMRGMRDHAGITRLICAEDGDAEATEVVGAILDSVKTGESKYADHTILYRVNAQSRGVEEALLRNRVPYIIIGGMSFYERKEVRDLLAYLRLAAKRGTLEDIKRSINTPFRFLGSRFVDRIKDAVDRQLKTVDWPSVVEQVAEGDRIQGRQRQSSREWAMMIRQLSETIETAKNESLVHQSLVGKPNVLLETILKSTRYIEYLMKEEGSESSENSPAANVREMIRVSERFGSVDSMLDYIDDTIKQSKRQREDKQAGGERVLLMTIHKSKGLEWPHVYVIGMNENVLPHIAALKEGNEEEERRIAYVAATRARDVLTLSYVRRFATRAGTKEAEPSRFLLDSGLVFSEVAAIDPIQEKHHPGSRPLGQSVHFLDSTSSDDEMLEEGEPERLSDL